MQEERNRTRRRVTRRQMIVAYALRGAILLGLAVVVLLILSGCLHLFGVLGNKKDDAYSEQEVWKEESRDGTDADRQGKYIVVLDAGHGGKDDGTVSDSAVEKDINLAIVFKIKEQLEAKGIRVLLTRDRDIYMGLGERIRAAEDKEADLFVSIHCNYYERDDAVNGLECYYCRGSEQGRHYADTIIAEIGKNNRIVTRNAKPAEYYVLKNTKLPAILVETGYLSNGRERRGLISDDYQNVLAEELANGIMRGLEGQ